MSKLAEATSDMAEVLTARALWDELHKISAARDEKEPRGVVGRAVRGGLGGAAAFGIPAAAAGALGGRGLLRVMAKSKGLRSLLKETAGKHKPSEIARALRKLPAAGALGLGAPAAAVGAAGGVAGGVAATGRKKQAAPMFGPGALTPLAKMIKTPSRALSGKRGRLTMTKGPTSPTRREKIRQALQAQGLKTSQAKLAQDQKPGVIGGAVRGAIGLGGAGAIGAALLRRRGLSQALKSPAQRGQLRGYMHKLSPEARKLLTHRIRGGVGRAAIRGAQAGGAIGAAGGGAAGALS